MFDLLSFTYNRLTHSFIFFLECFAILSLISSLLYCTADSPHHDLGHACARIPPRHALRYPPPLDEGADGVCQAPSTCQPKISPLVVSCAL